MDTNAPRRLIVNADDFGLSTDVNQAVVRAHREGILTTASLMVNEPGADEAVALARECPGLGVGLHLALVCGRSALPPGEIPGLVDANSRFTDNAVAAGLRYFFSRKLREQLRREIEAQFTRFDATGLKLDHVNGHLHMHLHPRVLEIVLDIIGQRRDSAMRLTRDPFLLNARLARGRWFYRLSHAAVYRILSARARPALRQRNIRHTPAVFGLLQNAMVDSAFVQGLLPRLPAGDSELYSHPCLTRFRNEFDALVNPAARALVEKLGIRLIRYQDL